MFFGRLQKYLQDKLEYWKEHPEWSFAYFILIMCLLGVIFLFCGFRTVGRIVFGIGWGVPLSILGILLWWHLIQEYLSRTPIITLKCLPKRLNLSIAEAAHSNGNPVKVLEEALQEQLEEFSTSMDTDWLVPMLHKIDSVGVPGDWGAVGKYLACEFEKLRDRACRAWTLNEGAVTFHIVMQREESDTLSLWIASANKAIMEKFNAAAIEQIEICEAESTGVVER